MEIYLAELLFTAGLLIIGAGATASMIIVAFSNRTKNR